MQQQLHVVAGALVVSCAASYATARPVTAGEGSTTGDNDAPASSSPPRSDNRRSIDGRDRHDADKVDHRYATDDLRYQAIDYDSHARPLGNSVGTLHLYPAMDEDMDEEHQMQAIQAQWEANRASTPVSSDSRGDRGASTIAMGKNKAMAHPFAGEHRSRRQQKTRDQDALLKWTQQRSPFHTSEVGKLASRWPHSIGLFKPEYPFLPSGRRRSSGLHQNANKSDLLCVDHTIPPFITHGNILKHGWTESVLDDDIRLSVPDEMRRLRAYGAPNIGRHLFGKKMYRWKPGEGYVWSRKKDLSTYKHGPGIALGQLLPPKDPAYTSPLPLIPNDSKRDLFFMIFAWVAFFTLLVVLREYRLPWKTDHKGKRRREVSSLTGHTNRSDLSGTRRPLRVSSLVISTTGQRRTRQRMEAQNFRDLCKSALLKGVSSMGSAASSTSTGLGSIRWSSGNGISSGFIASSATRRGGSTAITTHSEDQEEGATIELLEKGGIDGIVSPAVERGHFDMPVTLTTVSTMTMEDPRFGEWSALGWMQKVQDSERAPSTSNSSNSSTSHAPRLHQQ